MTQVKPLLSRIVRKHLGIRTLKTRNSDELDFHTLSVSQIEAALAAAYKAGCRTDGIDTEELLFPITGVIIIETHGGRSSNGNRRKQHKNGD